MSTHLPTDFVWVSRPRIKILDTVRTSTNLYKNPVRNTAILIPHWHEKSILQHEVHQHAFSFYQWQIYCKSFRTIINTNFSLHKMQSILNGSHTLCTTVKTNASTNSYEEEHCKEKIPLLTLKKHIILDPIKINSRHSSYLNLFSSFVHCT